MLKALNYNLFRYIICSLTFTLPFIFFIFDARKIPGMWDFVILWPNLMAVCLLRHHFFIYCRSFSSVSCSLIATTFSPCRCGKSFECGWDAFTCPTHACVLLMLSENMSPLQIFMLVVLSGQLLMLFIFNANQNGSHCYSRACVLCLENNLVGILVI